jgi:hypothetical protein
MMDGAFPDLQSAASVGGAPTEMLAGAASLELVDSAIQESGRCATDHGFRH